jgi:hypothetical protein
MKKITFTVEIGKDGYSACHEPEAGGIASTVGNTFAELKANAVESYNLLISNTNLKPITKHDIEFMMVASQPLKTIRK